MRGSFAMRGRPGTPRIREVPEREDWNLTRVGSWGMSAGQDLSMCEGMLYIFSNYDLESLYGERRQLSGLQNGLEAQMVIPAVI